MDLKKEWLKKLTEEFKKSPLATALSFGLIQVIFEKLVEVEFSCPCDSGWNKHRTLAFFCVPPVIIMSLMVMIKYQGPCDCSKTSKKSACQAFGNTIVPAITWLVIVFIDGRYYACLRTDWSGKYETIENAEPQKWCKPANFSQELLAKTQGWYSESQFIGFLTAALLTLLYLICWAGFKCCCKEQNPEASSENEENELVNTSRC